MRWQKFFGKNKGGTEAKPRGMRKRGRFSRGSVSLLLSVVLVPMLAFGGIAADLAVISAARSKADAACELAINGILSAYHEKLYDCYGLFARFDTAENDALLGLQYLEDCLQPETVFDRPDLYSLLQKGRTGGTEAFSHPVRLTPADFSVEAVPESSPANPTVLENQILSFMKIRGPLVLGENILERFDVLDTLETKANTASAKLKHDDALAKADDAARALRDSVQAYLTGLDTPLFFPTVSEGVRAACADAALLQSVRDGAMRGSDVLQTLSGSIETAANAKISVDSAAILVFCGEEIPEKRDETMRTLPRQLVGGAVPAFGSDSTPDALKTVYDALLCREKILEKEYPERIRTYSSAVAVQYTVENLSEAEAAELTAEGVDFHAAAAHAAEWISSAEYLFSYVEQDRQSFVRLAGLCEEKRTALETAFVTAAQEAEKNCRAIVEAADTLLCEIAAYQNSARLYEDLLKNLPEDSFKENLVQEYQTYKVLFDTEGVRDLKNWAEETRGTWEAAAAGPGAETARLFAQKEPLDAAAPRNPRPAGTLLTAYEERYRNPKQEGDRSLLDALKKLAAKEGKTDTSEETGNLKKVTEGDIYRCFGLIDALTHAAQTADISALEAFSVEGEASDGDISAGTAEGIGGVAAFFSGFGDVLAGIGEDILEIEYLTGMFSCASDDAKTAVSLTGNGLNVSPLFGNELEYLVFGNDSAAANKAAAIASVSAIRFVTNIIFAYSDSMTQGTATAIATSVAGWTGFGIPIVKNIVLICWTVAETAADMKLLLDGKETAVIKTKDTWHLSLDGLKKMLLEAGAEQAAALGEGQTDGDAKKKFSDTVNQCTYRDYLTLFLTLEYPLNKANVLNRCAKLIQVNMSAQEAGFQLTGCWTLAFVRCEAAVRTFFLHGAVSGGSSGAPITVDGTHLGDGNYGITVCKAAAY